LPSFEVRFTESVFSEHDVYARAIACGDLEEGIRYSKMVPNQNGPPEISQEELENTD
jgi:hypothetical protein